MSTSSDAYIEGAPCVLGCDTASVAVVEGGDRELGLPGHFAVVRCRRCGLMRTDPRPTRAAMAGYYPSSYAPFRPPGPARERERGGLAVAIRRIVRLHERDIPPGPTGRALEVGCASGAYLSVLRRAGWDVSGIEFSQDAAATARAQGFDVTVGPLETVPLPSKPVDLVVAWMVLEHLHDPVVALRRLRSIVQPHGWLACSVPDAGSLERRVFGRHWYALQLPRHLHHFDLSTLSQVLEAGGWTVQEVKRQRVLLNLVGSLGRVLEDRRGPLGAAGRRLATFPSRARRFNVIAYPVAVLLAAVGQTGRMTVWARPSHSESPR